MEIKYPYGLIIYILFAIIPVQYLINIIKLRRYSKYKFLAHMLLLQSMWIVSGFSMI